MFTISDKLKNAAALLMGAVVLCLPACNVEADDPQFAAFPGDWQGIYATSVDQYGVRCYYDNVSLSCVQVQPKDIKPPIAE